MKILRIRAESGTEDVCNAHAHEGLPDEAKLYAQQELNETEECKAEGIRKLKECIEDERKMKILKIRTESGTEDVHYPLVYEDLPDEAKLYAQQELNETAENKAEGLRKLKEFMKSEGLTCPDDNLLVIVLRNCKYDIPKSELKLKRFLRTHQLIINRISEMEMEKIEDILDQCHFVPLAWRSKNGSAIWYSRQNDSYNSVVKYEADDYVYCFAALLLFILQFPLSSIYGLSNINDSKANKYEHLFILNVLRKCIPLVFDMPYRFARMDRIYDHFFSYWCFKLIMPFIPEFLRNRIFLHGSDMESLYKFYHPDILPEHLGGTTGPINNSHYREEFLMFVKRLKSENINSTDL